MKINVTQSKCKVRNFPVISHTQEYNHGLEKQNDVFAPLTLKRLQCLLNVT